MKATKKSTPRVNPEPGTHMALLTQIIDWGTQEDNFGSRRKVEFVFELPEDLHEFNEERGEEPLLVTRKFALTISKKSALKEAIEGITGQEAEDEFELEELLEKVCQISTKNKKDGEYENCEIISYMPPPKGFKKKYKANGEVFIFDLDNFDKATWELIPDWKRAYIEVSPEYKELAAAKASKARTNGKSAKKGKKEELPF